MPSTRAGRARPSASNLRNISFLPRPVSIRRAVRSVSSKVELPELPDARMDTRNEIASLSQAPRRDEPRARAAKIMANCKAHVNQRNSAGGLKNKLVAGKLETVEVAHNRSGDAVGLKEFLSELLDVGSGDFFQHGDQLLRGVMPVEINVISRKTGHTLSSTFQGQKRCTLEVVLRAA